MDRFSTLNISDDVADTLFITLYMRHLESQREDRIIDDPEASRLVSLIDYDFSKYDKATRSQVGTCIRVRHFDALTRRFLDEHDDPVVVSLGCGLDSRGSRVGIDKGVLYNVDLPEVMELRDQLLPPDERNVSVHRSLFDTGWADEIRDRHPDAAFLVLSEGVLMYFPEEDVRPVLERIARTLAPGELVFDACTSVGCKLSSKHDTVKFTNARFRWGLDDPAVLEQWAPNLSLRNTTHYMDKEKHRWDLPSRLMAMVPPVARAFKMLEYDVAPA